MERTLFYLMMFFIVVLLVGMGSMACMLFKKRPMNHDDTRGMR